MTLFKLQIANEKELRLFAGLQVLFFGLLWLASAAGSVVAVVLQIVFIASISIGLLGLARPVLIRPFHRTWMMLVTPLGWVVSQLLMAVVYFLVVTPIGLWRRSRHGDPLKREFDLSASTYWEEHKQQKKSYFRQF